MNGYKKLSKCRISQSENLVSVLNLGEQYLTGVFPSNKDDKITKGPLELVWCPDSSLVQLNHSFSAEEMYGENYGYRSGLNQSMVSHLMSKVRYLQGLVDVSNNDIVLDIGSNDATLLKSYSVECKKIGIDPTGEKFASYYTKDIDLVSDFFTEKNYKNIFDKPAKIITSIAMFYDLDDPIKFAQDINSILDEGGIWHFEQSYLPSMLRMNSYDTICHEHLEYYSLTSVKKILDSADLKIVDVTMNNVNGGSFAVTAAKKGNLSLNVNSPVIEWLFEQESNMGINTIKPYEEFSNRVFRHRDDLISLITKLRADNKTIIGYGASTKGNVTLQFCNFTSNEIQAIAEVNEDKFGCFTPGTNIPIISEDEAKQMKPDYYLLLPWHFREGILRREKNFLDDGGKFIIPFPEIEII